MNMKIYRSCYSWIEIDRIESAIIRFPYLEIKYKDEESFFIDWSMENEDRFIVSQTQSAER